MVSNKSFILGRENQIRKLLITLGCSLTYGEGTENPSKQGWPPLLCEKLGFDKLINISGRGWSTSGIIKEMVEQVNFEEYADWEIYVLFFLPDPTRMSFYWDVKQIQHFMITDFEDDMVYKLFHTEPDKATKQEQIFYIKMLEQICENNHCNLSLIHSCWDTQNEMEKLYRSKYWLNPRYHVLYWGTDEQHKEHTAPCNHPNEKGYKVVADRIYEVFKKRHNL